MTSIKPKGPQGPGAPDAAADIGAAKGTGAPRESFRDALDATRGPERVSAAGPLASIGDDLRAGKIDVATAIERLVARALSSQDAAALPPARRAELEAHLRAALADDPALLALTKDLERAR